MSRGIGHVRTRTRTKTTLYYFSKSVGDLAYFSRRQMTI